MKIYSTVGGVGLFALSLTASALSLGQSQGQAVLGAPLDLVFQLEPDAGLDAAASCVAAEVMMGDRRVDGSRVRVTPLSTRAGQPAAVRVRASVMVDEPVVTVRLSAGCVGQMSRSYTFFAELPETVERSAMPLDIAQFGAASAASAAAAPARRERPALRDAAAVPRVRTDNASARPAPPPRPRKPAARPPQVAPAPAQPQEGAAPGESRLRMEPLNTWLGTPAGVTGAAGSGAAAGASGAAAGAAAPVPVPPAPAPAAPAVAAAPPSAATAPAPAPAAVAEAPVAAAGPAEADPRILALEAELQALRARDARYAASLAEMRSQLEAMQTDQGSPWTLPLLMALAVALAVLAWLLLRLRSLTQAPPANAWLHSLGDASRMDDPAFAAGVAPAGPASASLPPLGRATAGAAPVSGFGPSTLRTSMVFDPDAMPVHGPRELVKPEDLFDVRQQAEFFTSVGEYEQAIAVLRKHIDEHEDSSPLAYLELLGLFYQLSRRAEYDALRQQFEQHFAVRVPEMAQFAQRGQSLEHSPELLARIEALWPTDHVCELIEGALFRAPGQGSELLFDLEAFDDLLLLQAVARTTPADMRGVVAGRVRTTPAAGPVHAPASVPEPTPVAAAAMAATAGAAAFDASAPDMPTVLVPDAPGLDALVPGVSTPGVSTPGVSTPGDQPWATLERAGLPTLMPLPPVLEQPPLSLDMPLDFEAPPGVFARSEPLAPDSADSSLPAMPPLLDIDLSDVGRAQPLDLPAVESLPFDLEEFPTRPIVGSGVDQTVGFNPIDPRLPLPDDLELTPWDMEDSPDSILSAFNAARTDRVIAKPPAEDSGKDKPGEGRG
ncbi:hypothetical protein [Comamonas endophytica]|uniref:Tfp pilus assembly protein FimV n=1 Tax=Comamonas endophytica TaxID=2949090 RepID=A0ABY6G8R2_9BURK|nr:MULTISPECIES: hypothetical protein [unclassified Acidovorax]MCD2511684.1 hypothetical protein [Acidovorax sp. D4N7]UYG51414.1 hypothetical protein M9799_15330 [Acidovorax sp. 5MLIR]